MKAFDSQDAFLYRHLQKARQAAEERVSEGGALDPSVAFLKRFTAPVANRLVEKFIRDSLDLPENTHLTTIHVRRAVLSALLMPLRQSVGSCFATAPAILIQNEQQERFLQDFYDLINTGKLKRTMEGKEYTVPLSHTSGLSNLMKKVRGSYVVDMGLLERVKNPERFQTIAQWIRETLLDKHGVSEETLAVKPTQRFGAKPSIKVQEFEEEERLIRQRYKRMTEHALLKAWEYTLASFSDYKVEFFRWNLYASMGLDQKEAGGIGEAIYTYLDERLDYANRQTKDVHDEYAMAYHKLRATEALLANTSSYEELRRLKTQLTADLMHYQSMKEMRDDAQYMGERYSKFYQYLMESYASHLQEHFQELFDAELVNPNPSLFDDQPAGFRLFYKHGRSDPSQWTLINDAETFLDALSNFFRMTENQIIDACDWKKGKEEIGQITTLVLNHLRNKAFIESALKRSKKLGGAERTPWQYTAGGSMHTLVRCYYTQPNELTQEARPVTSATDLLTFYLDTLKSLPPRLIEPYLDNPVRSLLAFSPTHAFLLRPGLYPFKQGWLDNGLSYTWIRDRILKPAQSFYGEIALPPATQAELIRFLGLKLTPSAETLHLDQFRVLLSGAMQVPNIDAFFRSTFPLVERERCRGCALPPMERIPYSLYRALMGDPHLNVPPSVLFADTNWTYFFFGFTVNPSTLELELWRMDHEGFEGMPMTAWNHTFGTGEWGVLTNPHQYL